MMQRFRHPLPVVLGSDIGAHTLARQLHEVTGTSVMVVTSDSIVATSELTYITVVHQEVGALPERAIAPLRKLAQGRGPRSVVLMANTDATVIMISTHCTELEPTYVLPFPDIGALDAVGDKVSFSRLCAEVGMLTLWEAVIDLADPNCVALTSTDELGMKFPLVVKAIIGADYDRVPLPGKRKIWSISDATELAGMWRGLKEAGYYSTFLVQECTPGDGTAMRPVTTYVDSTGELCPIGSAHVLLQDHTSTTIGNPATMVTEAFSDLWEATSCLLRHAGHHGFASLDAKVDLRDGRELFFEVDPRTDRNSFYLTTVGANPMAVMLRDLVLDQRDESIEATQQILYSLVSDNIIARYVSDEALYHKVGGLGWDVDPLHDPAGRSLRRRVTVELQHLNHYRKFVRNYPRRVNRSC